MELHDRQPERDERGDPVETDPRLDPRLDALLDEALAGVELPPGLTDRIVAATRDMLGDAPPAGRIGLPWWTAVAAAVAIAIGAAAWFARTGPTSLTPLPAHTETIAAANLATLERDVEALTSYTGPTDEVDAEISALAMRVERARSGSDSGVAAVLDAPGGFDLDENELF